MKDEKFEACMTKIEKETWSSFKEVVNNFLGNYKDPNFKQMAQSMLENFKTLGCSCSLKVHFLMCHLDYFPENLGVVSGEHGERFHQDIKQLLLLLYCWSLNSRKLHVEDLLPHGRKRNTKEKGLRNLTLCGHC
ncbi:hypothetical protein AVEN_218730-1 [Araneus ventricosus]|uniref:Uncharacterized protein n=1 Tax=Araneus ventricosus TaxID=182803 RepID=A0A4Y2B4Q2_ARAVE|nr:hypothetical protein AVEN_218730-1 [Araneus ventricosus]